MCDPTSFTNISKHNGMFTDQITGTDSGKTDGPVTFTRDPFTTIYGTLFQIATQCFGNHFAHAQCSSRRRIDFMAMMTFDDLDVCIITHHFRRLFQQFETRFTPTLKLEAKHDADFGCSIRNGGFTCIIKTSRTNHDSFIIRDSKCQVFNVTSGRVNR